MELISKITTGLRLVTESAIALLALAVVLQVLFGASQPFFPVDVVGNIVTLTTQLGSQGVVGLVAVWVLVTLFNRK